MAKQENKEIYVADFETSHEQRADGVHTWVYLAGYSRINTTKIHKFGNIRDFINDLAKGESKTVYFHNLKFDGQFIIYYLLQKGFKWVQDATEIGQFSCTYSTTGQIFEIVIRFGLKNKRLKFLDSFKLYPYSVDSIAKQLKIPQQKLEMDYDIVRYENCEISESDMLYFEHDIIIIRKAIEIMYAKGYTKSTIGANALAIQKEIVESKGLQWRYLYPDLPDDIDTNIRHAYRGGFCYLNPKFKNKVLDTYSYDINSMYPNTMVQYKMPIGLPRIKKGYVKPKENEVAIYFLRCAFKVKENHIPTLQLKNTIHGEHLYLEKSEMVMDFALTNIDYDLFCDHYYTYELEIKESYIFTAVPNIYNEYIQGFNYQKENAQDGGTRLQAKLFNNNLYGKFGTNPNRENVILRINKDTKLIERQEKFKVRIDKVYAPVAIFTTSYSRNFIIREAQKNYDNFIYADTDSLHLTKPLVSDYIDDRKLGFWKFEWKGLSKHIKQKTYIYEWEGSYHVKCAGLNTKYAIKQGIELNFKTFTIGAKLPKIKMVRCIGGVYAQKQIHEIT